MNKNFTRIISAIAALGLVSTLILWIENTDYRLNEGVAQLESSDTLEQGVDLMHIVGFHYVSPDTLQVTDQADRLYHLKLVAACPGLENANDFSLVTQGYANMDQFTGIVVGTQLCRIKDFGPESPESAAGDAQPSHAD